MPERPSKSVENARFTSNLKVIDTVLKKHGVSYSLVGGLALKAILGETVPARRDNGTVYDFDAVAIGPDRKTIKSAMEELEILRKNDELFPEVGVEPIVFSDGPIHYSPLTTLSTMRKNFQGDFSLVYRSVEVPVPKETMEIQEVDLNGIKLPVFPAKTIFYRYLTRGGLLKMKDDEKLAKLQRFITDNHITEPPNALYAPYIDFIIQIGQKHPNARSMFEIFWNVDRLLGNKISGASGFIYGLIHFFREKDELTQN